MIEYMISNNFLHSRPKIPPISSMVLLSIYKNSDEQIELAKPNKSHVKKNISDFEIVRSLGKGSFGQVYMVKDLVKGKIYLRNRKILCNENNLKDEDTNIG